ncbi:Pol polyprotein, partial [Globisporangium splendens]
MLHSEKASKQFFAKPVPDAMKVPIPSVKLPDGSESSDPVVIADTHRGFMGSLFQSPSANLQQQKTSSYSPLELASYLRDTMARLSPRDCAMLDAPLTANDFYWAIVTSGNERASGPDGLPAEYYKLCPSTWARVYEVVYANQLAKGRMSKFQRRAYLSLLYKSGDRSLPSNYRPLTLLNHDAKFGPKILARRLGDVLPTIIHEDQSGFIRGRSIRHSLHRFQDLQHFCQQRFPQAGAVLLDFAKAFDSVLWPALDMVLHHFGFGDTFRAWIKTFYKGTLVSILINGSPGQPFELGAGVRQGDPLSPALFVIFIEPMLNFLRARLSSAGVKVGSGEPHLLLAFADDCTGLLEDIKDAPRFLELVQSYAGAAGLRLNVSKTCIMPFSRAVLASTTNTLQSLGVRLVSSRESVKLLGVLQGATITPEARFAPILQQMRQRCVLWKYRARTLHGKVAILRSIVLPLVWYTASVTVVPKSVLDATEVIIRNFVNGNVQSDSALPGKLAKEWIYVSKPHGGLGLIRPKTFVQATHLTCLRDAVMHTSGNHKIPRWFEPAMIFFDDSLARLGYGFDILFADIPRSRTRSCQWSTLPEYWYETLLTWRRLQDDFGDCDTSAVRQVMPLWTNFRFLFGSTKRPMHKLSKHNVSLIDQGFTRLQDFVDQFGELPSEQALTRLLDGYDAFARPASQTYFIRTTLARFRMLSDGLWPVSGPHFPKHLEAAYHSWDLVLHSGTTKAFVQMTNADFARLLSKATSVPEVPFARLSVQPPSSLSTVWAQEHRANRYLLPVFGDMKYRLQHNALGFRYKFKWHTDVQLPSTCVHGCIQDESAKHLFWECKIARHQWRYFLRPFEALTTSSLDWQDVLLADSIDLKAATRRDFGQANFNTVLTIIRGCVFRTIWLHRNKKMYNPEVSSSADFVKHHSKAYIELHLKWLQGHSVQHGLARLQSLVIYALEELSLRR